MRNRIVQALFTFKESDLFWSFRHSPVAIIALIGDGAFNGLRSFCSKRCTF